MRKTVFLFASLMMISGCTLEPALVFESCPPKTDDGQTAQLQYVQDKKGVRCSREECTSVDNCCVMFSEEQQEWAKLAFKENICPKASEFDYCEQSDDAAYYCKNSDVVVLSCQTDAGCSNYQGIKQGNCHNGECVAQTCLEDYHIKGAQCVADNLENCGEEGNKCASGEACNKGKCELTCREGTAVCGDRCVSYQNLHILECNESGRITCLENYRDCNQDTTDGCETPLHDSLHIATCDDSNGAIFCEEHYLDCDGKSENGCEIAINTNLHIAGCGEEPGKIICDTDFANCDDDISNGCEISLHDELHIERCGENGTIVCEEGYADCDGTGGCEVAVASLKIAACEESQIVRCETGWADCDDDYANGCETNIYDDHDNCGTCGDACGENEACNFGACGISCNSNSLACMNDCISRSLHVVNCIDDIVTCEENRADCNHEYKDGCEVDLKTDNHNCGVCGRACTNGHICENGACSTNCPDNTVMCGDNCYPSAMHVASCGEDNRTPVCVDGYRNCSGNIDDGCEIDIKIDTSHCGDCETACASGESCLGGGCKVSCTSGQKNCGGICVTLSTQHISDCTETGSITCVSGYGNCDDVISNGCEVNLNALNIASCSSGSITCKQGYANCDGDRNNGCEVDTRSNAMHCGSDINCFGGENCNENSTKKICNDGVCSNSCPADTKPCEGVCLDFSANHVVSCETEPVCESGYKNCDLNATNGCEIRVTDNNQHCGACNHTCGKGEKCEGGSCSDMCGDLDFCENDGMCVDLNTDTAHCGDCDFSCEAGETCFDGNCLKKCVLDSACSGGKCVDGVCVTCTTYSASSANINELCYISTTDVSGYKGSSTLSFPRAVYIQSLTIDNNTNVTNLQIPNLRQVESITVTNNSKLKTIRFERLKTASIIDISNNNLVEAIDLSSLVKIGSRSFSKVSNNASLLTLDLTSLSSVNMLEISGNNALKTLLFPSLSAIYQSLRIWNNTGLQTLRFPSLSHVFALTIKGNSSLNSTCVPAEYNVSGSGISMSNNKNNTPFVCQ